MAEIVVVGAGAAGCALAGRLTSRGADVLLLEAGGRERPPEVLDVASFAATAPDHPWNWAYPTLLRAGTPAIVPRGRGLGGSTAINGAVWTRAVPADADGWGVPGWTFAELLPYFRRAEHDLDVSSPVHGDAGPVPVRRPSGALRHPTVDRFLAAADRLGHPAEPDRNAGGPPGAGPVPSNSVDGVRVDAATAYLGPDVRVRTGALVERVLLRGDRAVGVELAGGEVVEAGEVVLAAGAVATPQLLLRSGIGPTGAHELPVGQGFTDHPAVFLPMRDTDPPAHPHAPGAQVALDLDSGADPAGDVWVLQFVRPFEPGGDLHLMCALGRPDGRGELTLDVSGAPRIEYRYLGLESDRRRMRHAVRTAAELLRAGLGTRTAPDGDVLGVDRRLDGWIAAHLTTAVHLCGTAAIGQVVDAELRVLGIAGLRVADTSVLPTVPRRGTAATAVAIGEKAADLLG
ncbi:GMC family oxidoreductase [Pseudonocardia sp. CA-107938]|uniref:GMC family oxidoreductase n=1 Tax=Pseudonocardia sp. CA-107938 TaxID=3240021 RepID=UPI003D89C260